MVSTGLNLNGAATKPNQNKSELAMLVVLLINQKDYELCPINHI